MKLHTKILSMCSVLMVLAVGSLTAYTTIIQQRTQIQREQFSQYQINDLLTQAIAGQYYSAINMHLMNVMNARDDLINRSRFIKSHMDSLYSFQPNSDIVQAFEQLKHSYNNSGLDLLVISDGKFVLPNTLKDMEDLCYINFMSAEDVLLRSNIDSSGTFVTFYIKDQLVQSNSIYEQNNASTGYIVYMFKLKLDRLYRLALVQNIDNLLATFKKSNQEILRQLQDSVYSIHSGNAMLGNAFILDASSFKLLLTTASDEQLSEYGFKNNYASQALAEQIAKNYKEYSDNQQNLQLNRLNIALSNIHDGNVSHTEPSIFEQDVSDSLVITLNKNTYHLKYSYYKPLNWFIVLMTDERQIVAPAYAHAKTLISIGFGVLVISLVICLIFSKILTLRLTNIAAKANLISSINLSDPTVIKKITDSLIVEGSDEVASVICALKSMGTSLSVNLQNLVKAVRQTEQLDSELRTAHQIQQGMLVPADELFSSDTCQVMALMQPAKAVGGDFYDVFAIDENNLAFMIGDVSDKGVPASLFMSMTMHLAKSYLLLKFTPSQCCELINNRLSERNPNMMFVTLCMGILNLKTGEFTICNAGHCLPVVLKKNEIVELTEISGPAVGPLPGMNYTQYSGILEPEQSIFLYTDGVSEAQNEKGEFFEVSRILDLLKTHRTEGATDLVNGMYKEILDFRQAANQSDDITMLCIKVGTVHDA